MKEFIKHLSDVFFPDPKDKPCPHCGGGKCLNLCGILGDKAEQGSPAGEAPDARESRGGGPLRGKGD